MAVRVCPLGRLQDKVLAAPCPCQLCCLRDVVPVHTDEASLQVKGRAWSARQGEGR